MKRIVVILLLAIPAQALLAQERFYITDSLQLGLHRAQDTSDAPFRNLVSGTEVTVLERVPNFARVQTAEGEEGWVKSAFLVSEKPARLRVAEAEARSAELEAELSQMIEAHNSDESEAAAVIASAELEIAAAELSQDTLARLRQENLAYEARMEFYRGAIPWPWVAGAIVVALIAGFVGGWWWLDASIRRRHGGFRLY